MTRRLVRASSTSTIARRLAGCSSALPCGRTRSSLCRSWLSTCTRLIMQAHMVMLKRRARYLRGAVHLALHLCPKGRLRIVAYLDSDWAGADDRRSTSGGASSLARACVLTFSCTQASRALSSCEAELYAMGSTSAEAMQLAAFLMEQGWCDEPPLILSDSSSGSQLTGRRGQGRLKHVKVLLLAI